MPSSIFGSPRSFNSGMIPQLMQFIKSTNPKEAQKQIEELLRSGKMTKEQFNAYKAQAENILKFLK